MNMNTNLNQMSFQTAQQAFETLYDKIIEEGVDTKLGTKAIYNCGFYIENPSERIITTPWRKWSAKYAEREWEWYLSKNRSVEDIKKYAPIWDCMHGGDNIVNSNYGWQWSRNGQLDKIIEQLKAHRYTRQAWISIYDGKEKDDYAFDTPCTIAIGFHVDTVDDTKLNMTVIMRSNDLVFGFCNDQYCFSMLQQMVCERLDLKMGTYYHFAHDMHIYERHFNMKK